MQAVALSAFGLDVRTELHPPGAWRPRSLGAPELSIELLGPDAIAAEWSGFQAVGWEGFIDGARFVAERGREGDHRFLHGADPQPDGRPSQGTRAIHHLTADARSLRCAPSDVGEQSWWRLVLDSVLFTVALLQGREALHAGAVHTEKGVLAITAGAGGGKSTLLAELLSRGAALISDDVLVLEDRGVAPPLAHPGPPLMTVPVASAAPSPAGWEICRLAQERWLAVPVHGEPAALGALVLLDRRPRAALPEPGVALRRVESPLAPLLAALMRFPDTPERERARFELAGRLASEVPVLRLSAELSASPSELADTLLAEF